MHENMGSVYAIPTGKTVQKPTIPGDYDGALVMTTGSYIDGSVNRCHDPLGIALTTAFTSLREYLNFPVQPTREITVFTQEVRRKPRKPIAILRSTGEATLNSRSLYRKADPISLAPESSVKLGSGIRLEAVVDSLAPQVAALEREDIHKELLPGHTIIFTKQTRLSPSSHQIKQVRRVSTDGLSVRTQKYIAEHDMSDDELKRIAANLFNEGAISLTINGSSQRYNLDNVYSLIKGSSKKKRDSFPQLHFFHALYTKFLDIVAARVTGAPTSAQDIILRVHEQPELGIEIPFELNDALAQETLMEYCGTTLPIEEMARKLKNIPSAIIAVSPALQLYEVLVASAGYTLFSHEESPIAVQGHETEMAGDYIATASAWPDLVVGAVNKSSETWSTMMTLEREFLLRRNPHVQDSQVADHLEKRLKKLFSGHLLNFRAMKNIDSHVLHAFLSGLATETPESQLILYERKAKLMVDEQNSALAPFELFDERTSGIIPSVERKFKDGASIDIKNNVQPGIRDSVFAVTQIIQLYHNLRQLSSLSTQPHPQLNWRKAIALRGSIIHIPLFEQASKNAFRYVPGNKYGIEMVDHASGITDHDLRQVRALVGQTIAERTQAQVKAIRKSARVRRNATPLRKVA